jgi:hypothetical protein
MAKPDHHSGSYQTQARQVRNQAYANPLTRCWQCHRTQAEHGRRWEAGHINDGQVGGALAPECEQCNRSRGATLGNRRRGGLRTTR